MYGTGRGVYKDYVKAYAWYNIAATTGNKIAIKNRDAVTENMNLLQVERAQTIIENTILALWCLSVRNLANTLYESPIFLLIKAIYIHLYIRSFRVRHHRCLLTYSEFSRL